MPGTSAMLPGRALVALALLVAAGVTLHGAGPAHAGHNSQEGHCITSYNYADASIGYLYASTSSYETHPDPCATVEVSIRNGGCSGTTLAYQEGLGYTSASATLDSGSWSMPCSAHYGGWWVEAHWLAFNY